MFSVVRTVAVAMASLFGSNMESRSFPFKFDIARRYAEHANYQNSHYGEQRGYYLLFNFFYSMFRGRLAPANPWNSTTLEWTTPRNPQHGNWPGEIPAVYRWPYDYSKPGAKDDFIPQNIPYSETPESNFPNENEMIKLETSNGNAIVVDSGKH